MGGNRKLYIEYQDGYVSLKVFSLLQPWSHTPVEEDPSVPCVCFFKNELDIVWDTLAFMRRKD